MNIIQNLSKMRKSASDNDLQIRIFRYRFLFICPFQRRVFYYFIFRREKCVIPVINRKEVTRWLIFQINKFFVKRRENWRNTVSPRSRSSRDLKQCNISTFICLNFRKSQYDSTQSFNNWKKNLEDKMQLFLKQYVFGWTD